MSTNGTGGIGQLQPPMGERRPMQGGVGHQLTLEPPQPAQHGPVPGALPPGDDIPIRFHAAVVEGIQKRASVADVIAWLASQGAQVEELAVRRLAHRYMQPLWDAERGEWAPPLKPGEATSLWATSVPGLTPPPAQATAPQAAPAVAVQPPKAAPAPSSTERLKKSHYEPIAKLHAEGKDTTTIAHALNLSPDQVVRALKKLAKDAPAASEPADPGVQAIAAMSHRAFELKPGDIITGSPTILPAEETILRKRGYSLHWMDGSPMQAAGWQVRAGSSGWEGASTMTAGELAAQAGTPTVAPVGVVAPEPEEPEQVGFSFEDAGDMNPLGAWLRLREAWLNEKLSKYGLRARIVLEL